MAILFDGSQPGDHYAISGASHPQSTSFTFKFRFKARSWQVGTTGGTFGVVFSYWYEATGGNDACVLTNDVNGVLTLIVAAGGSIYASAVTPTLVLNRNYEILLSYTANTTNGAKLYINGALIAQCNTPAALGFDDTYFGGGNGHAQDAYYDSWSMWTVALTPTEAMAEFGFDVAQKTANLHDTWNPTSYQATFYTGSVNGWQYSNLSLGDSYVADDMAMVPENVSITPTPMSNGQTGIVISGDTFGGSQVGGTVKISPTDNVADGGAVSQTVTAWGDSSITFTAVRSGLGQGTLYAFVTNNPANSNTPGIPVKFLTTPPVAWLRA